MRHAVIDAKTMEVVNVVIWEGAEWLPPRGHYVVQSDRAGIGEFWNEETGEFKKVKE